MNLAYESKPQQYQINVIILEGRHLALKYANAKVVVSIGKKKRTIHAKTNKTDSPYFNDFCVFNFFLPLNILLDKILTVKVYQEPRARLKKLVGGFKVDLATVWTQPNHQFYHKWAVLENPKNPFLGVRGFLKCDIGILTKGILINRLNDQESDNIPEEILVPEGGLKDRIRIRIVCSVYRADSFSPHYKDLIEPMLAKPYIKITYCDNIKKTSIAANKGPPVWNEEITFQDLYPPLSRKILFEICDKNKPLGSNSLANTMIDIKSLYEDGQDGFLPTFGPNFIYLYQPLKKSLHYRNVCTFQNKVTYFCRLLIAIRTETLTAPEDVKVKRKLRKQKIIPPLLESKYFEYNQFILFATIFDVLFFESKYATSNVRIRLTIGPKKGSDEIKQKILKPKMKAKEGPPPESLELPKNLNLITKCNTTPKLNCNTLNDYSFVTFSGTFPCVSVYGEWPDAIRRMYQSNIIKKAILKCEKRVNRIKYDLQFAERKRAKFSYQLKHALTELSKSCEVILFLTNALKARETRLFRERRRVNEKEIEDIANMTKMTLRKRALEPEEELSKISDYLKRLTKFAQDPENSFPDTEVWLLKDNQLIAQCTIKTEDVAFSSNKEENGFLSGKPKTIIIRGKKEKIKAKLDIFIWFGLAEDFVNCLEMLPSGYQMQESSCYENIDNLDVKIPSEITYSEEHRFQCRAHIFQAGIAYGFDRYGLANAFARVIVLGKSKKTQTREKTLSPIWDETLLFPEVVLYGPSLYIKNNFTTITVEFFDKLSARRNRLIGRSFVIPVVKLINDNYCPPRLKWEDITAEFDSAGQVLMVVELLEFSENVDFYSTDAKAPLSIPHDIRPHKVTYCLEIVFWGVRQLPKKKFLRNKVFVTLESSGKLLKSPILHNVKHKMNFPFSIVFEEIELPEEADYAPPLSVKLYRISSILQKTKYLGNCVVPSIRQFYVSFLKEEEKLEEEEIQIEITEERKSKKKQSKAQKMLKKKWLERKERIREYRENLLFAPVKFWRYFKCKAFRKCVASAYEHKAIQDDEKLTWWVKYNASLEETNQHNGIPTIKIYNEELEVQPQFQGFMDYLYTFEMMTGNDRKTKKRIVKAWVKAALKLYKVPESREKIDKENKEVIEEGIFKNSPTNVPEKVIVRVYIVSGQNLSPRDIYGKSDPYLFVQVGTKIMKDRRNYIPKQLNPTFGKCFEFKATFPDDYLLQVKVFDYDRASKDDLIGATMIDLENRYYSKYHASCGLGKYFEVEGFNSWRDVYRPTEILKSICERASLKPPVIRHDSIVIEEYKFRTHAQHGKYKQENQALELLNKWHEVPIHGFNLVPEHVETRSLYHPSLPGIEQGKLLMWVDIFPADYRFLPPKTDITPRPAEPMELRAIVWNVNDVVLDDASFIFKEKMNDIYVRGWILSLEEEMQKTDIHFRSLDGEGNFNWRFIFHFNYIPSERRMTVKKKIDAFDLHPEERKVRCRLEIQIWDNDTFAGDEFLGTLILELCSMPKGAKLASRCTLKMLSPNAAKINLFKIRKTRGWWPFRRHKDDESEGDDFDITGKIDLELEILTEAEAKMSPAGKGRDEPNPLPPPNRPVTSFNWWLHPGKVFRHIIWRKLGKCLIVTLLICVGSFFILIFVYSFPNYLVKKLIRA